MLTPIKCQWFNSRTTLGIVMAEDELGEIFYLIGAGDGLNENIDVNLITSFGAQFPKVIGDALFGVSAVAKRPASAKRVPTVAKKGAPPKKAVKTPRKSGK
jgi:hypothetical protein